MPPDHKSRPTGAICGLGARFKATAGNLESRPIFKPSIAGITDSGCPRNLDLVVTATGPSIDKAAQVFEDLGAQVTTVQADLTAYDGVEDLYAQVQATGRPVEAIAINAGIGVGGPFTQTDLEAELEGI